VTITQWCKANNIQRSTFYRWLQKWRVSHSRAPTWSDIADKFPDSTLPLPPKLEQLALASLAFSTDSIEPEVTQDSIAEDASLEGEVKALRGENRRLFKELGTRHRFEKAVIASGLGGVRTDLVSSSVDISKDEGKTDVDLVLCLGDWHIGDLIRWKNTEEYNSFDFSIAQHRMAGILRGLRKWVEGQRACYNITTCHVFVMGDMVSGGIHLELLTDEEFPPPVQCAKAGELLAASLRELDTFFPVVNTVFLSADNHSRTTIKPRHKRKVEFSLGHMVAAITKAHLSPVLQWRFVEPLSAATIIEVQGFRFLLQHGDYIRSYGITPDAAIEKAMMEEEMVRAGTENEFDVMVIGHFHRASFKSHLVTNGSLCGRTEYEHSRRFRPSPATQVSFLVHPTHGIFNFVPWSIQETSHA